MSTKLVGANTIKVGSYVVVDDVACKVLSVDSSKPGKHGSAKFRIVAVGLLDKKKREIVRPSSDNVPVPLIAKKTAQASKSSHGCFAAATPVSPCAPDLRCPASFSRRVSADATTSIGVWSARYRWGWPASLPNSPRCANRCSGID